MLRGANKVALLRTQLYPLWEFLDGIGAAHVLKVKLIEPFDLVERVVFGEHLKDRSSLLSFLIFRQTDFSFLLIPFLWDVGLPDVEGLHRSKLLPKFDGVV